jgi:hypothetical protein
VPARKAARKVAKPRAAAAPKPARKRQPAAKRPPPEPKYRLSGFALVQRVELPPDAPAGAVGSWWQVQGRVRYLVRVGTAEYWGATLGEAVAVAQAGGTPVAQQPAGPPV